MNLYCRRSSKYISVFHSSLMKRECTSFGCCALSIRCVFEKRFALYSRTGWIDNRAIWTLCEENRVRSMITIGDFLQAVIEISDRVIWGVLYKMMTNRRTKVASDVIIYFNRGRPLTQILWSLYKRPSYSFRHNDDGDDDGATPVGWLRR